MSTRIWDLIRFFFCCTLFLVKKSRATLSTNQMQNLAGPIEPRGQTSCMRKGISSGRSRTNFPRKISKKKLMQKQTLSRICFGLGWSLPNENRDREVQKCYHLASIVLPWKDCRSHSFARINYELQARALILTLCCASSVTFFHNFSQVNCWFSL